MELVCQCLSREEFKSCLSFLKKNNIVWCNNEEINAEKDASSYYDSVVGTNCEIKSSYIFLEKWITCFKISYALDVTNHESYYGNMKKGMNFKDGEYYYVVSFNTFIKLLSFYLKK